ncbi:MAG TPA: glycoside hydrolase family 20 zincin-like fold domain-containing protein, partial [Salinimicrobium sp.]|nr:glycoside hydrolase family 20 zincin-like fold domain-containing protein [Salinimicrobium sp.]
MKISPHYYFGLILLPLVFVSCSEAKQPVWEKTEIASATPPGLIPLPQEVTWGKEIYTLPVENIICYQGESGETAQWLDQLLKSSGMNSVIRQGESCGNIKIVSDPSLEEKLGKEGYLLDIDSTGISIKGASQVGLFYGVQTLRQFFPAVIE